MAFWKRKKRLALDEAAQVLAKRIGVETISCSQASLGESATHEMRWSILLEWAALFLHLLDREANEVLQVSERSDLLDSVWGLVIPGLVDSYFQAEPEKKAEYVSRLIDNFFTPRHVAYGQ